MVYKCPHCGGDMDFDEDVVLKQCPYWDSVVKRVEAMDNEENRAAEQKNEGCLFPAIAVIGFFALMFIGAGVTSLTKKMFFIPVFLILMFGWAIFFTMKKRKK